MMRALYTAASGMRAQQTNVDNISNNIANIECAQDLPFVGQNVHIQHGHGDKRDHTENERRALYNDILGRVIRRRGTRDDDDTERGADETHHEQENIRSVKKLLCVGQCFFQDGLLSARPAI